MASALCFPAKLCFFVLVIPEISFIFFYVFVLGMGQGLAPCTMRFFRTLRWEPANWWLVVFGSEDNVDVASTNCVATPLLLPWVSMHKRKTGRGASSAGSSSTAAGGVGSSSCVSAPGKGSRPARRASTRING